MAINTVKMMLEGAEYNLTYNGTSGNWEGTITAPSSSSYNKNAGHYFPVTVTATDLAGNAKTVNDLDGTLGASLRLRVLEKVVPVITVTSPTSGAYIATSAPTITAQLRDTGSGIDPATFKLKVDSGADVVQGAAGLTMTVVAGGYDISYVPQVALSNASHTVTFNVSDFDGNKAVQKVTTFTVDTIAPTLNVTAPIDGLITNQTALTVAGTTSDTNGTTVTIKLNGADQGAVTVTAGSFSKSITLSAQGANTIVVTSTDLAGKATTVTKTITLDTIAPSISAITLTPNPVDSGATFIISVSVAD